MSEAERRLRYWVALMSDAPLSSEEQDFLDDLMADVERPDLAERIVLPKVPVSLYRRGVAFSR